MRFGRSTYIEPGELAAYCVVGVIVIIFLYIIISGLIRWSRNNNSPILTVDARIVSKRQDVSGSDSSTSTWYYVTFELENRERIEFPVLGKDYGMLTEGDCGSLTYQGTRYKGFIRSI
ncbi:DUF2500 domain-containing protein [Aristaeella lactis]|uniref:Uncharacterized protein n=1 Tax=Aristaeella lactis TaxID=3046383 RepID=A0AC61PP01_9FIRM|nr:DUF2500 domain-containing protein [Aristaeella lactis]QUA53319.1 DUF2500 domain-containing protein [Aristaeella lactis]SMC80261.1 Protein of unknown function [Aristaeella lactis]